jgi:hypothetical protein
LIEKENTNYRKYPVTTFSVVKDVLDDKIEKLYTHLNGKALVS